MQETPDIAPENHALYLSAKSTALSNQNKALELYEKLFELPDAQNKLTAVKEAAVIEYTKLLFAKQ